MPATKQFIEDAIKGGWKENELSNATIDFHEPNGCNGEYCYVIDYSYTRQVDGERVNNNTHYPISVILLDPLAWQAVGRVRGWTVNTQDCWGCGYNEGATDEPIYHTRWHHFIDHLAYGNSIEEALTRIQSHS